MKKKKKSLAEGLLLLLLIAREAPWGRTHDVSSTSSCKSTGSTNDIK